MRKRAMCIALTCSVFGMCAIAMTVGEKPYKLTGKAKSMAFGIEFGKKPPGSTESIYSMAYERLLIQVESGNVGEDCIDLNSKHYIFGILPDPGPRTNLRVQLQESTSGKTAYLTSPGPWLQLGAYQSGGPYQGSCTLATNAEKGFRDSFLIIMKLPVEQKKEKWIPLGRFTVEKSDQGIGVKESRNMFPGWFREGATHVIIGKIGILGYSFDSDPSYPLTFKVSASGYVYVCGRGTVIPLNKSSLRVGYEHTCSFWLPRLNSVDETEREGAAQSLGYLAETPSDRDLAIPRLIGALTDRAMPVRRNAAESLGRIGDTRARSALQTAADPTCEADDWVRDVAEAALGSLHSR